MNVLNETLWTESAELSITGRGTAPGCPRIVRPSLLITYWTPLPALCHAPPPPVGTSSDMKSAPPLQRWWVEETDGEPISSTAGGQRAFNTRGTRKVFQHQSYVIYSNIVFFPYGAKNSFHYSLFPLFSYITHLHWGSQTLKNLVCGLFEEFPVNFKDPTFRREIGINYCYN